MRKLPKRPRTFGRTKYKSHKKRERQSRFLSVRFSKLLDRMIDSPSRYWHINYDEHGQYVSVGIDFGMPREE